MKVLALPRYGPQGASSRLRTHQFLPLLAAEGLNVTTVPLLSDALLEGRYRTGSYPAASVMKAYLERLSRLRRTESYDLIWIEKETLPWIPEVVEQRLLRGSPYVLDYDDATFHRYDQHRLWAVRNALGKKIGRLMSRARLVTTGNDYLADYARRSGSEWVEVIPTVVDTNRYSREDSSPDRPVRIVWIGTPVTERYLGEVVEPLERLAQDVPLTFRIVGGRGIKVRGVDVEVVPWAEETEASSIAECDIGIMPIPDQPFERGKCGYKLIQYMACELPVVASPVGVNTSVVQDGGTGWLARSPTEWYQALKQLALNPAERTRMGAAGRTRVELHYSTTQAGPRLASLLWEAAGNGGTGL